MEENTKISQKDLPQRDDDFIRIEWFAHETKKYTPGKVLQESELNPEDVGAILVGEESIIMDIRRPCLTPLRDVFGPGGGIKILDITPLEWKWLCLSIGRRHGLTMKKLRSILEETGFKPIGKIHMNNNDCLIGIREDHFEPIIEKLSLLKVNGVTLRPKEATPEQHRYKEARYFIREDEEEFRQKNKELDNFKSNVASWENKRR